MNRSMLLQRQTLPRKHSGWGEQVPGSAADTDGGRGLSEGPHGRRGREQCAKAPGQVPSKGPSPRGPSQGVSLTEDSVQGRGTGATTSAGRTCPGHQRPPRQAPSPPTGADQVQGLLQTGPRGPEDLLLSTHVLMGDTHRSGNEDDAMQTKTG